MSIAPPIEITETNEELLRKDARERVQWAVEQFGENAVLLSSMQKTACVLMHLFHELGLDNEVLFVDTGFHFHQTLRLRDEILLAYRLNLVTLYPDHTPEEQERLYGRKLHLFADGQPICCRLRKEEPFLAHMRRQGRRLVINGRRSEEKGARNGLAVLSVDPRFGGYALHPLVDWTSQMVKDYIEKHRVPIHPLHAQSYPSIGCACCTTPVQPGEDPRAGRWRHLRETGTDGPQYCGINFSDGSGI